MSKKTLVRIGFVLLAIGALVHCVRETRPKEFSVDLLAQRDGAKGTVGSLLVWAFDATGNMRVIEFKDNGFYTVARVSMLGKERTFVGLPIVGKFYLVDQSGNGSGSDE